MSQFRPLFALLLLTAPVLGTPMALFFDSRALELKEVKGHAMILTDKYVISTKFPLLLYDMTTLCAIPRDQSTDIAQYFCKDVERNHEAQNYDLNIIVLAESLIFTFGVGVVPVPAIDRFLLHEIGGEMNFLAGCVVLSNKRSNSSPGHYPEGLDLADFEKVFVLEEGKTETIYVRLRGNRTFCDTDNAMPLYCNQAVVGMFQLAPQGLEPGCRSVDTLTFVNFINEDAQRFLKDFFEKSR